MWKYILDNFKNYNYYSRFNNTKYRYRRTKLKNCFFIDMSEHKNQSKILNTAGHSNMDWFVHGKKGDF